MESCDNCRFFFHLDSVCRYNPPMITGMSDLGGGRIQIQSNQAPTRPSGWCGKHEDASTLSPKEIIRDKVLRMAPDPEDNKNF